MHHFHEKGSRKMFEKTQPPVPANGYQKRDNPVQMSALLKMKTGCQKFHRFLPNL